MRALVLAVASLAVAGPAAAQPGYLDAVGYTDLKSRLGAATPTGAGVPVAQVEALLGANQYLPNAAAFPGQGITDASGGGAVSSHATAVGQYFYGSTGIAPGIPSVQAYRIDGTGTVGDWYGPAYLNANSAAAPLTSPARVQNFSFVATSPAPGDAVFVDGLRRLDAAVARDSFVAVVAVNNGAGAIPALLANGYNTIAVGLTGGNSSGGPTTADVPGRSKPDLVVPLGQTSYATAVVSAAAALLLQTADGKADSGEAARAGRVETVKAVLLSGATTAEFASLAQPWHRDAVTAGGETFLRPLDSRFGAGELNVDNSHKILSAAEGVGTGLTVNGRYGWDYQTVTAADAVRTYYLDVPVGTAGTLTATVTWLREVPAGDPVMVTPTLSEIDLKVLRSDAGFAHGSVIDQSVSPVDNVQHVVTPGLAGGRYAIEVSLASLPLGQLSESFAVAWRLDTRPVPEPAGLLLAAAAGTVFVGRRFRR